MVSTSDFDSESKGSNPLLAANKRACSSMGEQRLCKPKVRGSSPLTVHQFQFGELLANSNIPKTGFPQVRYGLMNHYFRRLATFPCNQYLWVGWMRVRFPLKVWVTTHLRRQVRATYGVRLPADPPIMLYREGG